MLDKGILLPQRDFGLAGSGPSTILKSKANSARERIASHQGLSATGNKIIISHAHQGGHVHLLTPSSLDPALSSIHRIIAPSPAKSSCGHVGLAGFPVDDNVYQDLATECCEVVWNFRQSIAIEISYR